MAGEELEQLGDDVIKLSNRLKSVSSKQLLEYAEVAGQLGVKGSANILRFAETLAMLETASDISGKDGGSDIARFLNLTDQGVENVQAFGSEIVSLGNSFAATEAEILSNATRIAQTTGLYKLGRQEILAYATATRASGMQAEVVGSAFARTLGNMEQAIRTGKNLETFAALTGRSAENLKRSFKEDASGVFKDFIKGLNGIEKAGGSVQGMLQSLNITSVEDLRVISTLASSGYGELERAMDSVGKAGNAMQEEFDAANRKIENVSKRLSVSWDNLILSLENGQGIFAQVWAYMANEFADMLVSTKDLIDDVGVAWDVFGQYLDDFKPKAQAAGQANVIFADSFAPIKDFFKVFTIRNFVFMFTVEIPNAVRAGQAQLEVFINLVRGFLTFLSDAGPEIGDYLRAALNPFSNAKADSSGIDKLWNEYKRRVKAQNDDILAEADRVNEEQKRRFAKRYDDATNKNRLGEQEARASKELSPEQQAELERLKALAEQEKKIQEERLAAQRAMQARVDELNKAANRKQLSRDEEEIQAVKDKYQKMRAEIDAFYKNPKNKGLRIDASGLGASEQKELENVRANQEVEALKASLSEQQQLFQQHEQFKTEYGAAKARERFAGEIKEFESYVAYLKSLVPDEADQSVRAIRMREMLDKEIQKAEKQAAAKAFDENLKHLQQVVDATETANLKRLALEAQYLKDLAALEKEYAGQQHAGELAERKAALDAQLQLKREANQREAFEETAFFKKVMQDITFMTREELKERAKELRKILKDPKLSPIERSVAQQGLDQTQSFLDETNVAAEKAREIQEYANVAASSFSAMAQAVAGMNPDLSRVLGTMGQLANIGGQAAGAIAGFVAGGPAGIISGIQGAVGAVAGIISLFDNSEERRRRADERRQYAQELQIKSIEAATKALERQLAAIEQIYGIERLQAYGKAIDDITNKIKEQTESLKGRYVLTGDRTNDLLLAALNNGAMSEVQQHLMRKQIAQIKESTYMLDDLLAGVASGSAEAIEELQQLLDKKLLDEQTAAIVESLLSNVDKAKEAFKQMQEEAAGISFDSATSSLLQLFEQGKLSVQDFAKFFNDQMRQSIFSAFRRNVLEKAMEPFYRELAKAGEDGLVDQSEVALLQEQAAKIQEETKARFQEYAKILEGLEMGDMADAGEQDTLAGAIRKQLTEETGGKIAGIMQGQFGLMKQQLAVQEALRVDMGSMLQIGQEQLSYAMQTAQNTRLTYEGVNRMEDKLDTMGGHLGTIARNTSGSGASARDLGYDG